MQLPKLQWKPAYRAAFWLGAYALLWFLISGGQGWPFGLVVIFAALVATLMLAVPVPPLRVQALPGFLFFFSRELALGGWDVARRALHPQMPLKPAWVCYSLQSENPTCRLLLSALLCLLPGTLASRIDGNLLRVHVIDERQDWQSSTANLEQRLVGLISEPF